MNNQVTHISWQSVAKKSAFWFLVLFLCAVVQTSLLSRYRLFGAVPEIVLPTVVAIGIFDKERTGTIAGIMGGVIVDALGGGWLSLSPIVYMACGCISALLSYSILRREFISWLSATAVSLVVHSVISVISALIMIKTLAAGFSDIILTLVIPQYFSSIIMSIPMYFIIRALWLKFFDTREV